MNQPFDNRTDEEIRDDYQCYGVMWDPYDSACSNECGAYHRCLYAISFKSLPQRAQEVGASTVVDGNLVPLVADVPAEEIALETGVDTRSIEYAKSVYANPARGLPVLQADGTLQPSMKGAPSGPPGSGAALSGAETLVTESAAMDADIADNDLTEGQDVDNIADDAITALDNLQKGDDTPEEDSLFSADAMPVTPEEEAEPVKETPVKKKTVTKKKVAKKKTVAKKAAVPKAEFKKKTTAKKAPVQKKKKTVAKKKTTAKKAPTQKKAPTKKAAVKKAAPPKPENIVSKGPERRNGFTLEEAKDPAFASRFHRDSERPAFSDIKTGAALEKTYKGQDYKVKKTKYGWKMGDAYFPTLYAVQLHIEGYRLIKDKVTCSMSAPRFWGLTKKAS